MTDKAPRREKFKVMRFTDPEWAELEDFRKKVSAVQGQEAPLTDVIRHWMELGKPLAIAHLHDGVLPGVGLETQISPSKQVLKLASRMLQLGFDSLLSSPSHPPTT